MTRSFPQISVTTVPKHSMSLSHFSQYSLKALTLSNLLTHHVCSALQLPRDRENTKMIKSITRNNNYWEKTGGYKIEIGRNR